MTCLHPEAGYMTASVPKRVCPFESPLTARAGPYMYLHTAGKYHRLARRPSQGQKDIGLRAIMASQRPSHPCEHPRSRRCGRTSPAQAPSAPPLAASHHRCWLIPLLAAATAVPDTAAPPAASRRGRSAPRPCRASAQAGAKVGVSWHAAGTSCDRSETTPAAGASPLHVCPAWRRAVPPRRHVDGR